MANQDPGSRRDSLHIHGDPEISSINKADAQFTYQPASTYAATPVDLQYQLSHNPQSDAIYHHPFQPQAAQYPLAQVVNPADLQANHHSSPLAYGPSSQPWDAQVRAICGGDVLSPEIEALRHVDLAQRFPPIGAGGRLPPHAGYLSNGAQYAVPHQQVMTSPSLRRGRSAASSPSRASLLPAQASQVAMVRSVSFQHRQLLSKLQASQSSPALLAPQVNPIVPPYTGPPTALERQTSRRMIQEFAPPRIRTWKDMWSETIYHILYKLEDGTFFDMSEQDFAMMHANYEYRVCHVPGKTPTALLTLALQYNATRAAKDPLGQVGGRPIIKGPQDVVLGEVNFWDAGADVGAARESGFVNKVWVVGAAIRHEEQESDDDVESGEVVRQLAVPPLLGVGARHIGRRRML